MKKLLTILSLLASISGYSQVHFQYNNQTNKRFIVYDDLLGITDTIAANGVGKWRQVPAISKHQEIIVARDNQWWHLNSNRSLKDTTYTQGAYSFIITYDSTKSKYHAKLKTL